MPCEPLQLRDRFGQLRRFRQGFLRLVEHLGVAIQRQQRRKPFARGRWKILRQHGEPTCVLRGECGVHVANDRGIDGNAREQPAHDAHVRKVDGEIAHPRGLQAIEREQQGLEVRLQTRVAIDLGAELQRLARGMRAIGPRVQHGAAVAKPRDALAIEQVRVDARDLRRGVRAQAHHPPGELVDELEGLQVERLAGAGQQRLQVLQQRRHHQLAAVAARGVEQQAPELLDVPRLRRQDVGDVIRQDPGGHGLGGC